MEIKNMSDAAKKEKPSYIITPKDHHPFEVYTHDLPKTMTFLNAVKAVENLGNDWRIPTKAELVMMYERKDEIGNFIKEYASGSDEFTPGYWSSTEDGKVPSNVWIIVFSDGNGYWLHKDNYRLSCRPVRFVAAPAPKRGEGD
jgi:hypothetical protein